MSRLLLMLGAGLCAVGSVGCSEPVPPASQGAFVAAFQAPGACGKDIHNEQIGYADATEIRALQKNGVGGAQIFCAVGGGGGGFDIEAELKLFSNNMRINIAGMPSDATLDNPHPGTVTYQTQKTVKPYTSPQDAPCQFWFINAQEVAAGRVWAQFQCDTIEDVSTNTTCALGESTVALQNCDQ
jgi:hypothetical protein